MAKVNNDVMSVVSTQNQSAASELELFRLLCDSGKFKFKANWVDNESEQLA
jgi:hypothetical protein